MPAFPPLYPPATVTRPLAMQGVVRRPFGCAAMLLIMVWAGATPAQDHVVLGVGAAMTPEYQGADDYRVTPLPVIDIKKGWFFVNLRNGMGIEPINTGRVTVGMSAVYVPGYRRRDVPEGIERLSSGVGARAFADVRGGGFVGTLGATRIISGGTEGMLADISLSFPVRVSSRFALTPTVGTIWADRKHNDRYFGVSAAESQASGLPQFAVDSGFKDLSATLTAAYRMTDRMTIAVTGGVTSLLGEYRDSPIVFNEVQPLVALAFSYRL